MAIATVSGMATITGPGASPARAACNIETYVEATGYTGMWQYAGLSSDWELNEGGVEPPDVATFTRVTSTTASVGVEFTYSVSASAGILVAEVQSTLSLAVNASMAWEHGWEIGKSTVRLGFWRQSLFKEAYHVSFVKHTANRSLCRYESASGTAIVPSTNGKVFWKLEYGGGGGYNSIQPADGFQASYSLMRGEGNDQYFTTEDRIGSSDGTYTVTQDGVQVRAASPACQNYPSTGNCPTVVGSMNTGHRITPQCQKSGQTVGSNPYWVYGSTSNGLTGWVPSWWIDYPDNVLPALKICPDVPTSAGSAQGVWADGTGWHAGSMGLSTKFSAISGTNMGGTHQRGFAIDAVSGSLQGFWAETTGWKSAALGVPGAYTAVSAVNMGGSNPNGVAIGTNGILTGVWADTAGWHAQPMGAAGTFKAITAVNMGGTNPTGFAIHTNGSLYGFWADGSGWHAAPLGVAGAFTSVSGANMGGSTAKGLAVASNGTLQAIWADGTGWRVAPLGVAGTFKAVSGTNMGGTNMNGLAVHTNGSLYGVWADSSSWHAQPTGAPVTGAFTVCAVNMGGSWVSGIALS